MRLPDLSAAAENLAAGWGLALLVAATVGLALPAVAQTGEAVAQTREAVAQTREAAAQTGEAVAQTREADFEKIESLAESASAESPQATDNAAQENSPDDTAEVDEKTYLEAVVAASLAVSRGDQQGAYLVYLPLARRGRAEAQYSVGFMRASGSGVEKDSAAAVKWYRLAADQSHETAQLQLGLMLRDGIGAARDPARAHMWLSLAAAKGAGEARAARDKIGETLSAEELSRSRDMVVDWLRDHKDAD